MTKDQLKRYRPLKRELEWIDKHIADLEGRRQDIPDMMGRVTGSMTDFPYIEQHISVRMDDPRKADELERHIKAEKARRAAVSQWITEIEQFVSGIEDGIDREIIRMLFLEGKTQQEAGDAVGYSRSRISQKVNEILKD